MRAFFILLGITAILGLSLAQARSDDRPNADHLSPLDLSDKSINNYRSFLAGKLGVTPFDCGRVIDTPSFEPESFVSVYSHTQNGRRVCYVTVTRADANLWQRTKSLHDMRAAQNVGIQRIDAEISESVAKKIRQVWTRMLQASRVPPPLGLELELDGKLIFSIQQAVGSTLAAQLWLPAPGPKTRALVEMSNALWDYCKSAPANRPAIASKIDQEATRLLAKLKK
jgi:hypothetical protein